MSDTSILTTAGKVDLQPDAHQLLQSDPSHGIVHTRIPNGDIGGGRGPRTWVLRWTPGHATQATAVREHYKANAHSAFPVAIPGIADGTPPQCIYRAAPQIRHRSAQAADIVVTLEEALITD